MDFESVVAFLSATTLAAASSVLAGFAVGFALNWTRFGSHDRTETIGDEQ